MPSWRWFLGPLLGEIRMANKKLVCACCNVLPEKVSIDGRDRIRCARCGRNANLDVALRAASEHLLPGIVKILNDDFRRSLGDSKNVKYTPGRLPAAKVPDFIFN